MNQVKVTVQFGIGNSITVEGNSVGDCMARARAVLGFPENAEARVEGVAQPASAPVADGDTINVVPRAGSKAS
jgi:hypothetical protein